MQRRKAIISAASISLAFFSAATAMAVNTGLLLSPPPKGVGELNAVSADAIGLAPTTVPPAPPQTIIVTVPRSAVAGATVATASPKPAPAADPSPRVTAPSATAVPPVTSTTARTARTSTTVRSEDDEHDRQTTSTTRPAGGEDDD